MSPVDHTESCIRPAIIVNLSEMELQQLEEGLYSVVEGEAYMKKINEAADYEAEIKRLLSEEEDAGSYTLQKTEKDSVEELENPVFGGNENGEWEGDRVYFGNYGGSPILWRVLDTGEDKLVLLSEYALENRKFSKEETCVWETSDLRKWLNGTFLEKTFSLEE